MCNLKQYYRVYEKDEIEQGTKEWFEVRKLKFTASRADAISSKGKGLESLVKELIADYYSSGEYEEYTDKYKNPAMQRGNDFEAMARMVYEFETGNTVREVGFIERSKYVGCSPDGLVTEKNATSEDGLVEIKNHSDKVFAELQLTKEIDPKYIKQMQYQMWATDKKWCDYFGFNPNFKPNFYLEKIFPDFDFHRKIEEGVITGIRLIEQGLDILKDRLEIQEKIIKVIEKEEISDTKVAEDFPF